MLQTGKIKIRDFKELQAADIVSPKNCITPLRKRKNPKSAAKSKKLRVADQEENDANDVDNIAAAAAATITKTVRKKLLTKTAIKETPSNQKRIDSYFTSCPKTYEIKLLPKEELPTPIVKTKAKTTAKKTKDNKTNGKTKKSPRRPNPRRKRLFSESTEPSNETMSDLGSIRGTTAKGPDECITIDSESEDGDDANTSVNKAPAATVITTAQISGSEAAVATTTSAASANNSQQFASCTTASSLEFGLKMSNTSAPQSSSSKTTSSAVSFSRRKAKPCPPYKIIENTTFAVDAFQFGYIENVTHYFLTHFHADHYIGLTKSFAMPLFMSPITARLVRTFIPVQEQYIHVLELNKPYTINDIEITALDANHCPGSILIVFKFLDSGKCILHTGDFRAWFGMESERIFWNNNIDTIYLDTTYISNKYAFCTQAESIRNAKLLIEEFREKHNGKRILYICGSYIVGKEKFWTELAEEFKLKVWAEGYRYKALKAMDEEQFNNLLVEDAQEANMHVIAMGKVSYLELVDYFKLYEENYDVLFAIRPSGWEKDTKPRYSKKINIVGIEYSEHSSYDEMRRFVRFIKPQHVISTVPTGKDLMKTAKVPLNWYNYKELQPISERQPTIDGYMHKTSSSFIRPPNKHKGGVECFVSPLKPLANKPHNTQTEKAISLVSPKPSDVAETSCAANITTEIVAAQNQENSNNFANQTPALTRTTTSKVSHNSSEDFESPDLVITAKRLPKTAKKEEETKIQSKTSKKPVFKARKLEHQIKELNEKPTNIREENITINSPNYFMQRFLKDVETNLKENEDLRLNANQNQSEENDFQTIADKQINSQNSDNKILPELQQVKQNNIAQKRILRSKVLSDSATSSSSHRQNMSETKTQKMKNLTQKSTSTLNKPIKNPIIKSDSSVISIGSSSNNEVGRTNVKSEAPEIQDNDDIQTTVFQMAEESEEINYQLTNEQEQQQQELENEATYNINNYTNGQTETTAEQQEYSLENEIEISQNFRTRIESASSSKATSTESRNQAEKEFEDKLQKITQKPNKNSQQRTSSSSSYKNKTTKRLVKKPENPIYKSTTSIESLITDEELQTIKILTPLKAKETNSSDGSSSYELGRAKSLKRPILSSSQANASSTPFKKSHITSSLNTKAILNTILETNEDLHVDRFNTLNCSQLAGQIVEQMNKHNPDNSKDHIPADLLSDAEDDWI